MKKHLSFVICLFVSAAVLLITFAGCSQPSAPVSPSAEHNHSSAVQPGTTSGHGFVEPLVPAGNSSSEDKQPETKEPNATEDKKTDPKEGTQFVPAQPAGKFAAEVIPMPPINDLIGQIDEYVEKLGKTLEELDGTVNYKNDGDFVVRDANALALVALAVGKAEADSKYKKAAPGIIKASTELAVASQYDEAKKAYNTLKTALTSESDPSVLEWTKTAELQPLMKAVPNLSSTLTRLTNTERKLKIQMKKPERVFGLLAALAVIPQGSIANIKDTSKPDAVAEWKKECEQFRDAAIKANAALHSYAEEKIDYKTYWAAFKEMTDACDKCHQEFYPSAVGKNE
ncbi:MAG: hypothetical protein LBI18_05960 [Planctomycetaceae bacterium]|jgi:hypothetical protein|nr:hypothetical protein [Planctomycetaceae bacterium]